MAARASGPCGIAFHQHAAVALDDGQQIVEVVGHSGRQLADRLHALGLRQPGLQLLLLGDVEQNAVQQRPVVGARHQRTAVVDPEDFPVPPKNSIFSAKGIARQSGIFRGVHDLMIVRMHMLNPVGGVGKPFPGCVPEQRFDLRAHEQPFAFQSQLGNVSDGGKLLDQAAIAGFGLLACALVAHALADVHGDADGAGQLAVRRCEWAPSGFQNTGPHREARRSW